MKALMLSLSLLLPACLEGEDPDPRPEYPTCAEAGCPDASELLCRSASGPCLCGQPEGPPVECTPE